CLPGGHDVRLTAPFDLVQPAFQVAGVEVTDLDVVVGEPMGHQAPQFVTAAGLLGHRLAVLPLHDTDETVQGLDHDRPAAAGIGPFRAVLVSGAPVHAG